MWASGIWRVLDTVTSMTTNKQNQKKTIKINHIDIAYCVAVLLRLVPHMEFVSAALQILVVVGKRFL